MTQRFIVELAMRKGKTSSYMMLTQIIDTPDVKEAVRSFYKARDKLDKPEVHIPSPEHSNWCLECRMLYAKSDTRHIQGEMY